MATVTEYAGAASGTSWTTPTNANADDAAYATYTIAAKNTTGNENTLSNFGFDASIPAGATITSVALEVEHKVSTASGIAHLESAVAIGGTVGTFNTDSTEPTTDTPVTYSSVARPGGGSWTRNDLLDGTFTVRLRARSGNNATSVVYSWDYARVTVVYSLPTQELTPSLYTDSDTFYGPTVAAGAVNLAPSLYTDADTFYGPTVSVSGPQDLTPSLVNDGDTFYAPTVAPGAVGLAPGLFTDDDTFYAATVSGGGSVSQYPGPAGSRKKKKRKPVVLLDEPEVVVPLKAPPEKPKLRQFVEAAPWNPPALLRPLGALQMSESRDWLAGWTSLVELEDGRTKYLDEDDDDVVVLLL